MSGAFAIEISGNSLSWAREENQTKFRNCFFFVLFTIPETLALFL